MENLSKYITELIANPEGYEEIFKQIIEDDQADWNRIACNPSVRLDIRKEAARKSLDVGKAGEKKMYYENVLLLAGPLVNIKRPSRRAAYGPPVDSVIHLRMLTWDD